MEIKMKLTSDDLRRLTQLVNNDLDSAAKHALRYLLLEIAAQAGLCDGEGNPK